MVSLVVSLTHAARAVQTELTEEKFAADREELAKSRLEKPRGLQPLARKWHTEIVFATYRLDRDAQEVALLRALSRSDLLAYVDELLMSAKSVRRVSINVTGSAEVRSYLHCIDSSQDVIRTAGVAAVHAHIYQNLI